MDDLALEGKVAVISGVGSGIGRATAFALARRGARLVLSDIDHASVASTAREIVDAGGTATAVAADVRSARDLEALTECALDTYGGLDLACNNAGFDPPNRPLAEGDEHDWEVALAVNLSGVWLAMKSEIGAMLRGGRGGAIVNVSSIAGVRGIRGESSYAAGKHGVIGLTQSAALDYARKGIRINAVCPGPIATPMLDRYFESSGVTRETLAKSLPVGRLGTPDEVANAIVWLLSAQASFVTGHALAVDGGYLAR